MLTVPGRETSGKVQKVFQSCSKNSSSPYVVQLRSKYGIYQGATCGMPVFANSGNHIASGFACHTRSVLSQSQRCLIACRENMTNSECLPITLKNFFQSRQQHLARRQGHLEKRNVPIRTGNWRGSHWLSRNLRISCQNILALV